MRVGGLEDESTTLDDFTGKLESCQIAGIPTIFLLGSQHDSRNAN